MRTQGEYVFSSEAVGEGHPDKVADFIADSILDACLAQAPKSRVACEVLVKGDRVVIAGELTTTAKVDYATVARGAIEAIGYNDPSAIFSASTAKIELLLSEQAPEINHAVGNESSKHLGAGDQGLMFGYATKQTPEYLPAPYIYAQALVKELARLRKAGAAPWLLPDCKAQVAVRFKDGQIHSIAHVLISTQHTKEVSEKALKTFCHEAVIEKVLPVHLLNEATTYAVNPSGSFLTGGPEADCGVTGRKIIVDTYGGWARHGGGAFSGKDPTKVDRSAAYMARYVAKNMVAAGFATELEIQLAYAIGQEEPTSLLVNSFGTGTLSERELETIIKRNFSFTPMAMIETLDLQRPIYAQTTQFGHFTKAHLPWEQICKRLIEV